MTDLLSPELIVALVAIVAAAAGALGAVVWHSRKTASKVNIMVEAVSNGDFTLRFGRELFGGDKAVNEALHRLSGIMRREKIDLAKRENYFSVVLKTVRTGIVAVSEDGFVKQVNAEALRILGLEVLTHVRQLERLDTQLAAQIMQMKGGESCHASFKREGQEVNMLIRCSQATLGDVPVAIFALDDIRNSLDAKELDSWIKLTRVLTHEIMNSMSPISSISQTLCSYSREPVPQTVRDGLTVISDTAAGLLRFVEAFRRFSALPKPVPEPLRVSDVIADALSLALADDADSIVTQVKIEPSDLMIYADHGLIRQVVVNIVKNARQAIISHSGHGAIAIRAYDKNDTVFISIANDGPLIPDDVAEQIFVPFFTTKADGSGIGLSVSRQIMRLSHGSIDLVRNPSSPFKTTFVLTFQ